MLIRSFPIASIKDCQEDFALGGYRLCATMVTDMIRVARGRDFSWYDVEQPTADDARRLDAELPIHSLVLEELVPQVRHPKLDIFGTHLFVVLTIPILERDPKTEASTVRLDELDLVFGNSWIVTSHYRRIDAVDTLFPEEANGSDRVARLTTTDATPTAILYSILSRILQQSITSLGIIEERVERVENEVSLAERKVVTELSQLRRDIIDFRRALSPARPVFRALDDAAPPLLGSESAPYFRNLTGRIEQISTLLKILKETVEALEETNQALITTRTNDIVRIFTVITALMLPPALVTAIFSMNLRYPFEAGVDTFWWIVAAALSSVIVPLLWLRRRNWI